MTPTCLDVFTRVPNTWRRAARVDVFGPPLRVRSRTRLRGGRNTARMAEGARHVAAGACRGVRSALPGMRGTS